MSEFNTSNIEEHPNFKRGTGPGGPSGPSMIEARVAKLESTAEHIQRDVTDLRAELKDLRKEMVDCFREVRSDSRTAWGAIIITNLGLAGLMAKGFGWL